MAAPRVLLAFTLVGLIASQVRPGIAQSSPACSAATTDSDWPSYGRDVSNTRTQEGASIRPLEAATLSPQWIYDTGHPAPLIGYTDLNSTPVVALGCVFVGDAAGDIVALAADSGAVVWRDHVDLAPPGSGVAAGAFVGSLAVDGHRVVGVVNQLDGPYALAVDADTGALLWKSAPVDDQPGGYSNASPVVYDGVVLVGFSGPEAVSTGQGGFAILDSETGTMLAKTYTIPPSDQALGFAGGGIWSTAAVDASSGYAYVGTGNPFNATAEHPRTNAILKIDLDRSRVTFGSIVGSYKGTVDQYADVLQAASQPTCGALPDATGLPPLPPPLPPVQQGRERLTCLQLDLDFGASPNLFRARDGTLLVGELQKSGVYHVVRADTMAGYQKIVLGVSCMLCNGSSSAYDPARGAVFADVAPGTLMAAFDPLSGVSLWRAPIGDGAIHYQSVTAAGGVVYTVDSLGFLDAFDATTGLPVLKRPLAFDGAADAAAMSSSGIAVSNHTVYVAAGSRIIAYGPTITL